MQLTFLSGLFAVSCYAVSSVFQSRAMARHLDHRRLVLGFGLLAVAAHAVSAFGLIRTNNGFHFGLIEISTLLTVSISLLVLVSSMRKPLEILLLGMFPLAILSILASLTFSSDYPPTNMSTGMASHVLLSILAYSFITIAALQAAFLAYQNQRLKSHRPSGVLKRFPPLQDMEVFLFELLWVGEILLSLGIVAGLLFIDDAWGRDGVIHKSFFSILAWIVFAVLLWGRHYLGWRGITAIRWTMTGFALLLIGFYGSKIALQYILG